MLVFWSVCYIYTANTQPHYLLKAPARHKWLTAHDYAHSHSLDQWLAGGKGWRLWSWEIPIKKKISWRNAYKQKTYFRWCSKATNYHSLSACSSCWNSLNWKGFHLRLPWAESPSNVHFGVARYKIRSWISQEPLARNRFSLTASWPTSPYEATIRWTWYNNSGKQPGKQQIHVDIAGNNYHQQPNRLCTINYWECTMYTVSCKKSTHSPPPQKKGVGI